MLSNLPPGVTDSMIPGNYPNESEREWEIVTDDLINQCGRDDMTIEEFKLLVDAGRSAVASYRTQLRKELENQTKNDRMEQERLKYYINDAYEILLPLVAGLSGRLIDQVLDDLRKTGFVGDSKCQQES